METVTHALKTIVSGLSQEQVTRLANEHAIGGMLYYFLEDTQFESVYKKNRAINMLFLDEFRKLKSLDANFVPMKGIDLMKSVYPDLSVRPVTDIDLFSEDPQEAECRLREQGYQMDPKESRLDAHKSLWRKKIQNLEVTVELHSRWFAEFPEFYGDRDFYFVYLCSHLAHQHTFIKLFWLIDLLAYIEKYSLDWLRVDLYARQYRRKKAVFFCIEGMKVASGGKSAVLDLDFLRHPRGRLPGYLWVKHMTKDSWREALSYDVAWLIEKCSAR